MSDGDADDGGDGDAVRKRRGREQQHQGQDNQFLHAVILARLTHSAAVEIAAGTFPVSPFLIAVVQHENQRRIGETLRLI